MPGLGPVCKLHTVRGASCTSQLTSGLLSQCQAWVWGSTCCIPPDTGVWQVSWLYFSSLHGESIKSDWWWQTCSSHGILDGTTMAKSRVVAQWGVLLGQTTTPEWANGSISLVWVQCVNEDLLYILHQGMSSQSSIYNRILKFIHR